MIRARWAAFAAFLLVPCLVLAQVATTGDAPPTDFDPLQLLGALVKAVQAGQWPVAVVLLFVGLTWAVRKFGVKWLPWLGTSEGGTVLAFLTTMSTVLGAAALAPGAAITWALAGKAAAAAFAAIGAWTGARRLLRALLPLVAKIPAPLGPTLAQVITWIAGEPADVQVKKAAEAAYKPTAPTTAQAAADALSKPPAP